MWSYYIVLATVIASFSGFRVEAGETIWQSGVINVNDDSAEPPPGLLGSFFKPIFGSIHAEEQRRDNFILAILPLTKMERILFVTPQIVKKNPEAVKESFIRLYCNLLGILIRDREIGWMTRGRIFNLLPHESQEKLRNCIEDFERVMELKLQFAMIDLGPDCLIPALEKEFKNRGILLFRHPLNIVNQQIYYNKNEDRRTKEYCSIPWYETVKNNRGIRAAPFTVYETYYPVVPMCEEVEREPKLNNCLEEHITEEMEKIYGHFEEVSLVEEEAEKTENCTSIDKLEEEGYEIVDIFIS